MNVGGEIGADGLLGDGEPPDHSATSASMFSRPWMRDWMKSLAMVSSKGLPGASGPDGGDKGKAG